LSEKQSSAILLDRVFAPVADHESDYAESAGGSEEPPIVAPSGACGFVDKIVVGPTYEGRSRQAADSARQ